MPRPTDSAALDPDATDAYALTPQQFETRWRNLGRADPPSSDEKIDANAESPDDEFGDAYEKSRAEFNAGWKKLGHSPRSSGQPLSYNLPQRLAEIRKNYSVSAETPQDANEDRSV